jgi:hypothetical protein
MLLSRQEIHLLLGAHLMYLSVPFHRTVKTELPHWNPILEALFDRLVQTRDAHFGRPEIDSPEEANAPIPLEVAFSDGNPRPKRNHFLVQNGTTSGLEAGPLLVENGTACVQGSSWWRHDSLLTSTCSCSRGPLSSTVPSPGETEAGSAETQPDQGIARPTVCRWHSAAPKGFALLGALFLPIGHQSPCLGKSRGSGGRAPRAASSP